MLDADTGKSLYPGLTVEQERQYLEVVRSSLGGCSVYKDVRGRDRGHLEVRDPKLHAHLFLGPGHFTSWEQS